MLKYLILVLILSTGSSQATTNLIIPLYTDHINVPNIFPELEEDNRGVGIEYITGRYAYSMLYLKNNSFGNEAYYASVAYRKQLSKDFSTSAGLVAATGYYTITENMKVNPKERLVGFPLLSVQWKSLRLVTSYPFGSLAKCGCADFVNIQYIHEF